MGPVGPFVQSRGHGWVDQHGEVAFLDFGRRDEADKLQEPEIVEAVILLEGCELDGLEVTPRSAWMNKLGIAYLMTGSSGALRSVSTRAAVLRPSRCRRSNAEKTRPTRPAPFVAAWVSAKLGRPSSPTHTIRRRNKLSSPARPRAGYSALQSSPVCVKSLAWPRSIRAPIRNGFTRSSSTVSGGVSS
jgi:hypothetical protein